MITKWDILNSVVLKECLEVKTDELANLLKRKRVTMTNLRTTTRLIKKFGDNLDVIHGTYVQIVYQWDNAVRNHTAVFEIHRLMRNELNKFHLCVANHTEALQALEGYLRKLTSLMAEIAECKRDRRDLTLEIRRQDAVAYHRN